MDTIKYKTKKSHVKTEGAKLKSKNICNLFVLYIRGQSARYLAVLNNTKTSCVYLMQLQTIRGVP